MNPILNDGDMIVCKKTSNLNTEKHGKIIKKIKWIDKKELRVEGSNPRCHSSACDFNHDVSKIIGKVVKIIR